MPKRKISTDYTNILNSKEIGILDTAMDTAEKGVCYEMESKGKLDFRDLCEECIWELNWVKAVIAAVITVVVWIFSVITLGLGTLIASVISITVWTAVWVLHCYWVECEEAGPCEDGQEPFCELGFVLNLDEGVCELDDIYQNPTVNSDNCIKVDKLPNGDCPGESMSIPRLSQCILFCFGNELPDGFGQTQDGDYIYPYECQ